MGMPSCIGIPPLPLPFIGEPPLLPCIGKPPPLPCKGKPPLPCIGKQPLPCIGKPPDCWAAAPFATRLQGHLIAVTRDLRELEMRNNGSPAPRPASWHWDRIWTRLSPDLRQVVLGAGPYQNPQENWDGHYHNPKAMIAQRMSYLVKDRDTRSTCARRRMGCCPASL